MGTVGDEFEKSRLDISDIATENAYSYTIPKPAVYHLPYYGGFMFGGLGIWAEILKIAIGRCPVELSGLVTSILTFFPALIGSTTLQLILASSNQGSTDKIMISFALLLLCVFLAFAVLLPFVNTYHPIAALVVGSLCSLAAVWVWWITNGHDPMFNSQLPDAPTGGSVDRPLAGSEDGFRVE